MIHGHIDFSLLPAQLSPQAAEGNIQLPGFTLHLGDTPTQLLRQGNSMLVVRGTPHVLGTQTLLEDWSLFLPELLRDPAASIARLAGRFSLLWLDCANRRMGFAADRLNTFGYCYAQEGSRVYFAERADQVALPGKQIAPQAIFDYLYFHMIPAPSTIFKGVRRLAPGAFVAASQTALEERPWWQPKFEQTREADFEPLAEEFRSIIRDGVVREADSGQRLGAFLSGGTDSSTVVGMLSRALAEPAKAYSIGFDSEGYDEMAYARIAARRFGVEHREYYITPEDLLAKIPDVAAYYDQPFGNSSALPAYYCAKMARDDGLSKLLAGDGGDELFGGNTRYAKQRVFGLYQHVPQALRSGLIEPLVKQGWAQRVMPLRKAASYVAQANTPLPDRNTEYNLLHRNGISNIFEEGFLQQISVDAPLQLERQVWAQATTPSELNRLLQFDWRFTLADNDLPKVIGTTAMAGMDVAFPLLSDELIDFSLKLPDNYKLRGFKLRWFFKEALKGFLPNEIITKQKHGFGLPFGPWTLKHAGLNEQARTALTSLGQRGIVRASFLQQLMDSQLAEHPGYYGEMVWICQMLEHWLQAHAPDFRM